MCPHCTLTLKLYNRAAELMFEKYQVPALFLAKNAVSLSFYFEVVPFY